jgi:hypothetical protein
MPWAWLSGARARAYALILALGFACGAVFSAAQIVRPHGPAHLPEGVDFVAFTAAATLARQGHAPLTYAREPTEQLQRSQAWIAEAGYYPYNFPPLYTLLILPLGFLPYWLGYLAFVFGSGALLVGLLSRVVPAPTRLWRAIAVLAFPGILINVEAGQNGLLTASAFAAGMIWLERQPALAGAALGMLLCKPHLAVAVPIVLVLQRRWRALAGFCGCGAVSGLASLFAFGVPVWVAFLHAAPAARAVIEASRDNPARMASVFAAARLLGAGLGTAYACQALSAAVALSACVRVRRSHASGAVPMMVAAGLLITPYLFDYDLACLAIPLAWLLREGVESGFRRFERPVTLAALFLPLFLRPAGIGAGVPIAPPVLACLLYVAASRQNTRASS